MTIRKLRIPASLALVAFLGCSAGSALLMDAVVPQHAAAQDVDDGYFYANLAPHGQWFFQADFGWVWHPARVSTGWRPYTEGQWVWSNDVGWVWASQEPWGWATYHYGRWYFDPMYGWSWVPGRTWAPAWVSWRIESGYVGWAPLWPAYFDRNPEYRWDRWHHDSDWDRRHHGRDWDRWVFTRDRDFTSERVGRVAIRDRYERDRIFQASHDVTRWDENRPDRLGYSIDRRMIEKAVGRPIHSVRLETADKPDERDDPRQGSIRMFRPHVQERPDRTPDRLGLAKEPSREARQTDTIRQEKARLDNVPARNKERGKDGADRGRGGPSVREKDDERGGVPETMERQLQDSRRGKPQQKPSAREGDHGGTRADKLTEPQPETRAPLRSEPGVRKQPQPRAAQPAQKQREQAQPARMQPAQKQREHVKPVQMQPAQKQREHVKPAEMQPAQKQREHAQPARMQPEQKQREHAQPAQVQPAQKQREHVKPAQVQPAQKQREHAQPARMQPAQKQREHVKPAQMQPAQKQREHVKPAPDKNNPKTEDPGNPQPDQGRH